MKRNQLFSSSIDGHPTHQRRESCFSFLQQTNSFNFNQKFYFWIYVAFIKESWFAWRRSRRQANNQLSSLIWLRQTNSTIDLIDRPPLVASWIKESLFVFFSLRSIGAASAHNPQFKKNNKPTPIPLAFSSLSLHFTSFSSSIKLNYLIWWKRRRKFGCSFALHSPIHKFIGGCGGLLS